MEIRQITSQNFGALRLYDAEKALKALPVDKKSKMVSALERASYELQDTQHCHLEIGRDLEPVIDNGANERYRGFFNIIGQDGDYVQFGTIYDGANSIGRNKGDRIIVGYKAKSREAAQRFYEEASKEKDGISLAAKLVRFIEDNVWNRGINQVSDNPLDGRIDRLVKNNDYYNI